PKSLQPRELAGLLDDAVVLQPRKGNARLRVAVVDERRLEAVVEVVERGAAVSRRPHAAVVADVEIARGADESNRVVVRVHANGRESREVVGDVGEGRPR